MKRIILDSKSNRYFDENGYLVIKDNKIAKAGVFEYLGREISDSLPETEIYKVYRPWEELEKSAKDFEGMPLKYGHEWVQPEKRDIKIGAVSGEVKLEEPYLIADIKIYDKDAIEEITNKGIVDLSPGYRAHYKQESGEYNGEKYEFKQEDIKYNHLAVVENGRSGKEVRIADEHYWKGLDSSPTAQNDTVEKQNNKDNFLKGEINMKKRFMRHALGALSHVKKVYDECITSKTDDTDKRELIRDIVAIAVKPDTDFEGGEEEKFETILKKAEELGYEPSETSDSDMADADDEDKKSLDSDMETMREAYKSFSSLFDKYLSQEMKEPEHAEDDDVEGKKDDTKQVSDSYPGISKKTMDAEISKAILNERKRTQDAIAAYQDVERFTGSFNMTGLSADEIYQYAYEVLTGDKVRVSDAKPSFKAYIKAVDKSQPTYDAAPYSSAVKNNLSNFVK